MNLAAAIIPAAGFGSRMQADLPKQYLELDGVPILVRTVQAFLKNSHIKQIVVPVPAKRQQQTRELFATHHLPSDTIIVVTGGKRRQDSVKAGLDSLDKEIDIVLVHDGARPLVSQEIIDRCYAGAVQYGAVIAAVPVKDTLKRGDANQEISQTIDRTSLWQAQTPQAIRKELLEQAYLHNGDIEVTDEASLLEGIEVPVKLVEGGETNIKITRPEDLLLAQKIVGKKREMNIRIGHGYDAHRFAKERKLVLGGVTIPHTHGLAGHSDADVLTHALCDALLGAICKGDIGKHFPDSDQSFNDIYSINLLKQVMALVNKEGFQIGNIDLTIICQAPRLADHLDEMQKILAATCTTSSKNINIKATTTEKMGFTGRQEGISSHAMVLLQSHNNN